MDTDIRIQRYGCMLGVCVGVFAAVSTPIAQAAGLLIADSGLGGVLEIREHTARVTVNNGIAVTEVTQVFRNTENRQVEALYVFPVPKGASVANFSMWIGGKEMVGEVVEKQRAREIYDSYRRVKRDPGLLEQKDYKTFEMRIFPIEAGAEQKVQISYYQELDFDHDWATYVYPLATSPRQDMTSQTTNRFGISVAVKSEIPIVAVESPSHPKEMVVAEHADTFIEASMEATAGDLSRDVVLAYRTDRPRTGIDMIASRQPGEDGYFLLTLTAGEELPEKAEAMDYVFVLDSSGSMAASGKLGLSRDAVQAFVNTLATSDRFEIIAFNVAPKALFNQLQAPGADPKAQAQAFLGSRAAGGGTVLRPAVLAAYRYADPARLLNVVVLSDGMTEQEDKAVLAELIRSRPANTRVFCIGVGNEVNRPLLEQLADEAGGLAAFLSPDDNIERQANAFRKKLMHPAAENVSVEFSGGNVHDLEPQRLPDLFHGSPVRLYGRYRTPGAVKVTVRGDVAGQAITSSIDLTLPEKETANPQIERMWAWHKVQSLLREPTDTVTGAGAVPDIIRLGEGYSIATQYTSFLVLENDGEYQRWKIDRRNALRIARDRKPQEELATRLDALRDKALERLGPRMAEPESAGPVAGADRSNSPGQQISLAPPAQNAPSRPGDLDFTPRGGGPVGPVGLAGIAVLACLERRRRRMGGGRNTR